MEPRGRFRRLRIPERHLPLVLGLAFALVMALLGAAGVLAMQHSRRIRFRAEELAGDHALIARLARGVQVESAAMSEVLRRILCPPESVESTAVLLATLDECERELAGFAEPARAFDGGAAWSGLREAVRGFAASARAALRASAPVEGGYLDALLDGHEHALQCSYELIHGASDHLAAAELSIEAQSDELAVEAKGLLGTSFVLAAICAALTLRFAHRSIRRLQWQSDELSRVGWHMLQSQEDAARKFSHELHDELGQSLAALRSSLTRSAAEDLPALRRDCLQLVDESIANVRELSQLLRPVILDDLGLDAALRFLVEKFSQRTGVQAVYTSNCAARFEEHIETHLFRIAQEALTNVARHAQASRVSVELARETHGIRLRIADDGRGLSFEERAIDDGKSLGMVGMRARARQCAGELQVMEVEPHGLRIEAVVPIADITAR